MKSLLSTSARVEAPIIIVKIGDSTFGLYDKTKHNIEVFGRLYSAIKVSYPNYLKSLNVVKINGALNTYTLVLEYAITSEDDPNLIDRILSSVSKSRSIEFTYGDAVTPSYMYREEKALITKVRSVPDIANSKIVYTISAVSTAIGITAATFDFPEYSNRLPSDIILNDLLYDRRFGLLDVFYGMHDKQLVLLQGLILADDKRVNIEAKPNTPVLDYLRYLVDCMLSVLDSDDTLLSKYKYVFTVHDDITETLDGPYFKISKMVTSAPSKTSVDVYEVDIGYPNKDKVRGFSIIDDLSYAILYDYSEKLQYSDYVYRLDDYGNTELIYSPSIAKLNYLMKTTLADKSWWSSMTQFPIKALLQIKGLLRAIILMSYIRINVYYYGKKHNSSGLYIVTKQEDSISTDGYVTTLSLTRILGDSDLGV